MLRKLMIVNKIKQSALDGQSYNFVWLSIKTFQEAMKQIELEK